METGLPLGRDAEQGVNVRYGLDALRRDWRRCSLSSDFVGAASVEARYAQRVVSGAVNELLELVYRSGSQGEGAALTVRSTGENATISLELPLPQPLREQMTARIDQIIANGAQRSYLEQLGADGEPEALFGVLHLMVDYGAELRCQSFDGGLKLLLSISTTAGGRTS